ncbi:hypothetical protein AB0J43_10110 [Nonomuraea fuscirosea]
MKLGKVHISSRICDKLGEEWGGRRSRDPRFASSPQNLVKPYRTALNELESDVDPEPVRELRNRRALEPDRRW